MVSDPDTPNTDPSYDGDKNVQGHRDPNGLE